MILDWFLYDRDPLHKRVELAWWKIREENDTKAEVNHSIVNISEIQNSNFSQICASMLINLEKFNASICYKTQKTHFSTTFCSKTKVQDFSKIIIWLSCKPIKNRKMFHASIFHKTWKTSFWAHFVPLLAQKLRNKIFPEKIDFSQFWVLTLLQLAKIHKKTKH